MYKGSMVAVVTPMADDGSVDYDAYRALVEFHIDQGTNAIVSVGTTGESATLSHPEHAEVIAEAVKMVGGRVPLIAGTGANSTSEAIELTAGAKRPALTLASWLHRITTNQRKKVCISTSRR